MNSTASRSMRSFLPVALGLVVTSTAVSAQEAVKPRVFVNPPRLQQSAPAAPERNYGLPVGMGHAGTERAYELTVQYSDGELFNPSTGKNQKVRLRSYTGPTDNKAAPFVAPEIEAAPGDTVRITLHNRLPVDASCGPNAGPTNSPHCFNGTNLHSHGLWVSPTGNSDNVLISLNPGQDFQYEYNIPADHPAGTFWYHTHRHGSTALQVSSGMAGALILHGDRLPRPTVNGDLDTLLVTPVSGSPAKTMPMPDRTLVLQQIAYACADQNGQILYQKDDKGNPTTNPVWSCTGDQIGMIESYNQFTGTSWTQSGRWTSINGIVLPSFTGVEVGKPERWRFIHAGVEDTIKVSFVKASKPIPTDLGKFAKEEVATFINEYCKGSGIPSVIAAADGLTLNNSIVTDTATLQPGYRYDLLPVFTEPGTYCILSPTQEKSGAVGNKDVPQSLLGFVAVTGTALPAGTSPIEVLVDRLTAAADAVMPEDVKRSIKEDLAAKDPKTGKPSPKFTRFVPHPTITNDEIKKSNQHEEKLVFYLGAGDQNAVEFAVGHDFETINYGGYYVPKGAQEYNPDRIDRSLVLGAAQQWELRSYSVSHPFHIHVNPFQIVAIYDPNGNDVSLPGVVEADGDSQFAGLSGAWKDTLFVKTKIPFGQLTADPKGYYRVIIRTRYERYIGEFVLHCHILDHEDQGMMQNVQIGLSDGMGGIRQGHH